MAKHVCPWWLGYLLANPLRAWIHDPETILKSHIREGMHVLEIGPGMGFFTLPMARMVGAGGRVVAIDIQEKMVLALARRAGVAGLEDRVEARCCGPESLGLENRAGNFSFALAFAVVHEVSDQTSLLTQIHRALMENGHLLLAEPRGHVSAAAFTKTLGAAQSAGFIEIGRPAIRHCHTALLESVVSGN